MAGSSVRGGTEKKNVKDEEEEEEEEDEAEEEEEAKKEEAKEEEEEEEEEEKEKGEGGRKGERERAIYGGGERLPSDEVCRAQQRARWARWYRRRCPVLPCHREQATMFRRRPRGFSSSFPLVLVNANETLSDFLPHHHHHHHHEHSHCYGLH